MFYNFQSGLNQTTTDINNQNSNQKQTKRRTRIPFTKEEDQQLLQLVQYVGVNDKNNWYFIASQINGRTPRQCRERYQLFLRDDVKKKEKWTKEEDDLLISKYQIYGPHWKQMEQFFVGRTSYSIKNRYISLSRRFKLMNENSANQNQIKNEVSFTTLDNKEAPTQSTTINNEYSVFSESDFDFDLFPLFDGYEPYAAFE